MKARTGCLAWLVLVAMAAIIVALTGCAVAPEPEFVSPWGLDRNGQWNRPIPKPTACGPKCFSWEEPGLMVGP